MLGSHHNADHARHKGWLALRHSSTYNPVVDPDTMRSKVEQDIAFLTAKIAEVERQPRVNTLLLENYQSMLKSRTAVLKWLLDGGHAEEQQRTA